MKSFYVVFLIRNVADWHRASSGRRVFCALLWTCVCGCVICVSGKLMRFGIVTCYSIHPQVNTQKRNWPHDVTEWDRPHWSSLASAKCDINCWRWHHLSSLVTVPRREVYFSATLFFLTWGCHILPQITTDLLWHTLQADGVSQRMTTNIQRPDKTPIVLKTVGAGEVFGYLCNNIINFLKMQDISKKLHNNNDIL